jgi:pimeloyl-ACP methyl ester carboxylesterase
MSYLERDGVRLRYDVDGNGSPTLLTHGFAASSGMFAANVPALARDHTVLTWDLIGHGDSDYPAAAEAYSVPRCVADMAALLDTVGADRAIVGGHSLGGYLSLEFRLAHPDRVAGLVLIDSGPGFRSEARRAAWNELAERSARGFTDRGLRALSDSEELSAAAHRDASGLVLVARNILVQRDARVLESLGSVAVPTLILVGEHDASFLAGARYMADTIPGARLEVIADAGHAPNVSQPTRVDELLSTFAHASTHATGEVAP